MATRLPRLDLKSADVRNSGHADLRNSGNGLNSQVRGVPLPFRSARAASKDEKPLSESARLDSRDSEPSACVQTSSARAANIHPRNATDFVRDSGLRAQLTDFERDEVLSYPAVWYHGQNAAWRKKLRIANVARVLVAESGCGLEPGSGCGAAGEADFQHFVGDHIGYRYEVVQNLGKGSFGQVLKCRDHLQGSTGSSLRTPVTSTAQLTLTGRREGQGQEVAVKIIRREERLLQQGLVEAKILQYLNRMADKQTHHLHDQQESSAPPPPPPPPIVRLFSHFHFRGHLCLVFELLSDFNLYEFAKKNRFQGVSLSLIRRFGTQLLHGLAFLRQCGIIHCDLKPENVVLVSREKSLVKIVDFGSSCFEEAEEKGGEGQVDEHVGGQVVDQDHPHEQDSSRRPGLDEGFLRRFHTPRFTYIQSRYYRAPEVILNLKYDGKIDMWSVGCILAELYTGSVLFPGANELEQMGCILEVFGCEKNAGLQEMAEKSPRRKLFFQACFRRGHGAAPGGGRMFCYVPREAGCSAGSSTGSGTPSSTSSKRSRKPGTRDLAVAVRSNDARFTKFLSACLSLDPRFRATPSEALHSDFILDQEGVSQQVVDRSRTRRRNGKREAVALQLPPSPGSGIEKVKDQGTKRMCFIDDEGAGDSMKSSPLAMSSARGRTTGRRFVPFASGKKSFGLHQPATRSRSLASATEVLQPTLLTSTTEFPPSTSSSTFARKADYIRDWVPADDGAAPQQQDQHFKHENSSSTAPPTVEPPGCKQTRPLTLPLEAPEKQIAPSARLEHSVDMKQERRLRKASTATTTTPRSPASRASVSVGSRNSIRRRPVNVDGSPNPLDSLASWMVQHPFLRTMNKGTPRPGGLVADLLSHRNRSPRFGIGAGAEDFGPM